ncbi:LysR family transcriptional regulator [Burkholderia oklahomensis]|uniref:LysR family transcriptional regulator n=1 Tax=Burkholderia oklahomensis TaxID=342113 RepID=UPI00264DB6F2|nr:LysR family transcriptional regulator [Burkholderia oklahomensis]MDN7676443.1 LysR family transcriptional regulator [Burkholderia oklahomensis]
MPADLTRFRTNTTKVSLRHLRAFAAVAREGSFTAAAGTLYLTQSALTKTIRELEQALGVHMFERNTRRIALTAYGEAFLIDVVRILNDLDLALNGINQRIHGSSGTVRVASGLAFASTAMPRVIHALHEKEPGIHLDLITDTSGGVVRRIESGEIDVGIGSYIGMVGNALNARRILSARLGILFPVDYPQIPPRPTLKDLNKIPILRDADDSSIASVLRQHAPEFWGRMGRKISVTNLDLQLALVREGIGACIVSALAASHPSARSMPYRLFAETEVKREVFVFTRCDVSLLPAAARFLDVLMSVLPSIAFVDGVELTRDAA